MMCAYSEIYLDDAMGNLGEMVDYAVNACRMEIGAFWDLFIVTGYGELFGQGVPRIVAGLSGTELVCEVVAMAGLDIELPPAQVEYTCSPEYWCGWIMAYYQWKSARSFKEIRKYVSIDKVLRMYSPYHEVAEDKFADTLDAIIRQSSSETRLQMRRRACGYSQRLLSEKSGVNIRNIQQYEQRVKNINHAAAGTIVSLSRILNCRVDELLEFE